MTRGLLVIVSVAVMATLASLMPQAGHAPLVFDTLGQAVYRMAFSGSSIVRWEMTVLYVALPSLAG